MRRDEVREARHCLCFNLRRAARSVTQLYDEALRPAGLRATQFTLLSCLTALGPSSVNRLADVMVVERTTLSRNVARLEREGLVASRPGEDRRIHELAITARGRRRLARAFPLWRDVQHSLTERLGDPGTARLVKQLDATVAESREALDDPPRKDADR